MKQFVNYSPLKIVLNRFKFECIKMFIRLVHKKNSTMKCFICQDKPSQAKPFIIIFHLK